MSNQEISITQTPILNIQQIRLIDVFIIAPFCFYVASQKNLSVGIRTGLILLGAATLIFNGSNYLLNRKKL